MSDPLQNSLRASRWEVTNQSPPSAVDRLAAIEDPTGDAGQRCLAFDQAVADREEIEAALEADATGEFAIDTSDPDKHSCKVIEKKRPGGTIYGFGVIL